MKTQIFKINKESIEMVPITGVLDSEKDAKFIEGFEESFSESGIQFKIEKTDKGRKSQVWRDLEYTKKVDEREIYWNDRKRSQELVLDCKPAT